MRALPMTILMPLLPGLLKTDMARNMFVMDMTHLLDQISLSRATRKARQNFYLMKILENPRRCIVNIHSISCTNLFIEAKMIFQMLIPTMKLFKLIYRDTKSKFSSSVLVCESEAVMNPKVDM